MPGQPTPRCAVARPTRLNKLLSQRGVASRRGAEKLIADGKVTIDGEITDHPAERIDVDEQDVRIDGEPLPPEPEPVYLMLYKPRGTITGRDDPQGRKSVLSLLPPQLPRVEPVGRLDYDTEGALLLTNDGHLAHHVLHPSAEAPRRYHAKVYRTPSTRSLQLIRAGKVYLEDGPSAPAKVRILERTESGNAWVEITLSEGRNRLVRRLFEQLGHPVSKLRRESFATISIRGMKRGEIRHLRPDELRRLHDIADGEKPSQAGRFKYKKGYARPKPKKRRHGKHKKGSYRR